MKDYRLGLYEKAMPGMLPLVRKLNEAGKAGFDYMELSVDETNEKLGRLDMSADKRAAVRRACEETGVPIVSMCLSAHRRYPLGSPDPTDAARSLEIMEKALFLAGELGIRQIQLAGYDVYYTESTEETRRRFEENLYKAAGLAARYGVMIIQSAVVYLQQKLVRKCSSSELVQTWQNVCCMPSTVVWMRRQRCR